MCRRVFFSAHQEHVFDPDLIDELAAELESEHLFDPSDPHGQQETMDELVADILPGPRLVAVAANLCAEFCEGLGLSHSTSHVARQMVENHYIQMDWDNHTPLLPVLQALQALVVSTVLYMVTHLMNEHRSLEEISRVSGIPAENSREVYRHLHSRREELIESNMLGALPGGSVQDFLNLLPPPTAENGFVDHEEFGSDLEHYLIPAHPKQLEDLCVQHSDELDQFQGVSGMCLYIARKIREGSYLAGLSPLPVAAVSLFMASHLASSGTTIRRVSEVVGISEGTVRNAYRSVYPRRRDLIDSDMLDRHEEVRRYRVLQAITWPAL